MPARDGIGAGKLSFATGEVRRLLWDVPICFLRDGKFFGDDPPPLAGLVPAAYLTEVDGCLGLAVLLSLCNPSMGERVGPHLEQLRLQCGQGSSSLFSARPFYFAGSGNIQTLPWLDELLGLAVRYVEQVAQSSKPANWRYGLVWQETIGCNHEVVAMAEQLSVAAVAA